MFCLKYIKNSIINIMIIKFVIICMLIIQMSPQLLSAFFFTSLRPCVNSCTLCPSPATLFPIMLLCQAYTVLVVTARIRVLQF